MESDLWKFLQGQQVLLTPYEFQAPSDYPVDSLRYRQSVLGMCRSWYRIHCPTLKANLTVADGKAAAIVKLDQTIAPVGDAGHGIVQGQVLDQGTGHTALANAIGQVVGQYIQKQDFSARPSQQRTSPAGQHAAGGKAGFQGARNQLRGRSRPGRERPPLGSCRECGGEHPECYSCPNDLGKKDEHYQSIMKPDWYCRYKCGQDAKRICGGKGHVLHTTSNV